MVRRDVLDIIPPFWAVITKKTGQVVAARSTSYIHVIRAYILYTATATAGDRNVKCVLVDSSGNELKLAANISVAAGATGEFILTNPFFIGTSAKFALKVEDENSIDANDTYKVVLLGYFRFGVLPEVDNAIVV